MADIVRIHNYLDKLSIEEVLKYYAQGFELVINDGHVQAMVLRKEAQDGERA